MVDTNGQELTRREKHRRTADLDDDVRREIIRHRVMGESLRRIGDWCEREHGVRPSAQTIHRWVGEARTERERVDPERMNQLRAGVMLELDTVAHEAWRIVRGFPGTEHALKAMDRVIAANNAAVNLLGLRIPVRQDVVVYHQTDEDRALLELVNETKARIAAEETRVIEAATQDPDL